MLKKLLQVRTQPRSGLQLLIITLLVLGIFFRFVNLDRKVYWFDEIYTSLRASGYTEAEVLQHLPKASVISLEDLHKYQRPHPEKSLINTIESLAVEDPQHPPFYYVFARFWMQGFGSSAAVMRTLPALISLLAFPCIYWLCLELFESPLTGWVAVALLAVSPLHLLYAQEAREYSLWTVTTLLSSLALLRAMRLKTQVSWGIYTLMLAANLYTFLLSFLVAIGQGIYVAAIERFRLTKTLIAYLVASVLGIIAFLPWIVVVIVNRVQARSVTAWTGVIKKSLGELLKIWTINISRVFIDFNYSSQNPLIFQVLLIFASIILVFFISYSLYFICRNTQKHIWLFILALIATTTLPFVLPDLVLGGVRSITPRYFIPSYLGIQLSVSYLLTTKLTDISANKVWQQKLWQLVMATLVSGGVLSCAISSQAETWWHQTLNRDTPTVAHIINQAESSLLIGNSYLADIVSLSYQLNSKVKFLINPRCYTACNVLIAKNKNYSTEDWPYHIPEIPKSSREIFLFKTAPSKEWMQEIEQNHIYKIEPQIKPSSEEFVSWLWRLEKQ